MQKEKTYVVIPNWNGVDRIRACLDSLRAQTAAHQVVVVDNGSADDSIAIIESDYPEAILIKHSKNRGFAGGVNAGIKYAIGQEAKYVALLNNDAVADKNWLEHLVDFLDGNTKAGIAASKICDSSKTHLDSTGENYTIWGLPFPRGRGESDSNKYDNDTWVFGASGGASLYRIKMLDQIGLFDEDFFAYYEDVDISFRAQLAGWKVGYVPSAEAYHEIGATSGVIRDFTTYQTLKNLPMLFWKNVPAGLLLRILPRFTIVYLSFYFSALYRGQFWAANKGLLMSLILWPKKLVQRYKIQSSKKVATAYIDSVIIQDLPPGARKLRKLFRKRLPA
jgi:GT2 family glycosyltransferase